MDLEERYGLVARDAEEIITPTRLRELLRAKKHLSAYIGYEPSGRLHLGHKLGIDKMIDLQKAGFKVIVLLADIHAHLNEKGELKELRETARQNKEIFEALGLDPDKTMFVLGGSDQYGFSDMDGFQRTPEYQENSWKLMGLASVKRAMRSVKMLVRDPKRMRASQIVYPFNQAADMIALNIDVAVGGSDQRKIHMLAEDTLPKLGFTPPVFIHMPITSDIKAEGKMSSSQPKNIIALNDPPNVLKEKITSAICPPKTAENNPVLEIARYHILREKPITIKRKYGAPLKVSSYPELKELYEEGEIHPADLKKTVYQELTNILKPVREKALAKNL